MKKRSRLKKGLAILLTAAMVVGLVPNAGVMKASATETYDENGFAADGSYQPATDNDSDGVYEIGNAGQLYWFAALVNGDTTVSGVTAANTAACAELVNDITVNDNVLNDDGTVADDTSGFISWTPIGSTYSGGYTGKFDGKGHTISGLYLINNSTDYTYVGLFGVTRDGAISSLGVVDSYFAGASYVGGVCACHAGGTISNCYNAGSVCGLASSSKAGGVCGSGGVLKHCYNKGKVSGSGSVGSLIGQAGNTIENCYYLEDTANQGVGKDNASTSSNVIMKTALQFESGEVTYLLNQSTSSGTLAWYQNIKGDAKDDFPVLDSNHGTVYQVTDGNNQITYINQALCQHKEYNNGICTSCGELEEPAKSDEIYQIENYGNFLWFANEVNRGSTAIKAELTCDITANDNHIAANGSVTEAPEYIWTPIGNATNNYTGKFDGKGHTISGLYVKSTTDYVGLFGYVRNAEISNVGVVDSYFDGADYVGGICGYGIYVTITNCYNTGEVRSSGSSPFVGGVCGKGASVIITNCYNTGKVSGSGDDVGGVCGSSNSNSKISNCYYLVGMPAGSNTTAQTDMFECSISQFASGEVAYRLQGEQKGTVWGQTLTGDNRQYSPVLGGAKVYATTGCVTYNNSGTSAKNHNKENGICKDCGVYDEATYSDGDNYYEIGNAGQLYWFAQQINSGNNNINAVLTADITVNKGENTGDVANCNGTKADGWIDWVPIGNSATGYEYTGTFDGQNHTVSGLYFNDTNTSYVGLFGYNTGTIKNVGVVDSYFNSNRGGYVGGVCGANDVNATITNCYNTGTVGGRSYVGGVCGDNGHQSTIENCYNTGKVSGTTSIGGVCGYNDSCSTVKNCYNTGQVSGTTNIGGVCGYNDSYSTVKNCYYLTGTAENGVANNQGTATNVESKATDKFKSGEVAYLLNEGKSKEDVVWRQNLGETEADATPVLDSSHKIVYASKPCEIEFANTEFAKPKAHTVTMSEDGTSHTCSACNKTEQHADVATFTVDETEHSITATCPSGCELGTIRLSASDATYDGTDKAASISDEIIKGFTTPDIVYEKKAEDGSFATIDSIPKDAGTYRASITYNVGEEAKKVYSVNVEYTIWLDTEDAQLTDQDSKELTGNTWWAQSVTFTPPEGFTICDTVNGTYSSSYTYNEATQKAGTEVIYYLKNSAGEIAKKTATVRVDWTAPDWSGANDGISIKTNKWKSLLSTISFGLFYKETVDVTVSASDSLSGVAKYYYYVDTLAGETVKTKEELDALANGEGGFTEYAVTNANAAQKITSLSADSSCVVYVYAVDKAGNKSDYICSNGVVIDKTAPTISDISTPSEGSGEDATLTDTKADMTFTASESGTYFYIVKKSSEGALTAIADFADSSVDENTGMTVWNEKDGVTAAVMTAGDNNKLSLTGLTANTAYTVYVIGVDRAGNASGILSQSFTTCKTLPKVTTNPTLSGTYGTAVSAMTLTNGVAKAGDTVIDGTWELTDANSSDVPGVGTTKTYEVTFTPNEKYNGQYDTVLVSVIPTVERKAVTVTAENKSKTYGQENPELTFTVPEGSLVGSDTEEALGVTLSCEATKTSLVTEGGYAITGTSSSANYKVTVTPGILTISQAAAEITVGTESYSKTFGDAAFNLGVTDNNTDEGADVTYAVSDSKNAAGTSVDNEKVITVDASGKVTIVGAGSATITASLAESNNFTAATSKTIIVTVAKKTGYTVADIKKSYLYSRENADTIDLSKYLPANCGMVTYGEPQASGTVEYTVSPAVADGKLSYTVKTGSVGETGTIKVNVGAENYEEFTITVNVKLTDKLLVKLKDGSSVTLQNSTLTYGQALSTLSFNSAEFVDDGGKVVTGNLAWKTPDGKPKVGTTSATWVFTPNNEAYEAVEDTVGITVNKATPNVTALPTVAERTYHPTVSLTDTDLVGGTVNVAGSWNWQKANLIPTVNNSGYVAVFTPEDSTNYETVTRAITVTVTKATPYIKTAPTAAAVTYGDTLGASMLSGGTVQYSTSDETTVVGSFTWKDSSVKPSVSDSGTTAYRIVFNPSDAENYNTAETGITLTVNKAENAPNMPSSTMNVANSCTKVSDVTLPTGWVWQDADQNTALTVDTPVTATAVYNGADAGNYVKKTVSVTITRSALNNGGGSSSGGSSGGGNNGGGSSSGGSSSGGNNGGNSSTGGSSGGGNSGGNSSTGGSSGGGTEAGTGDQSENSGNTTTITNGDGSTTTTKTETDTNGNTITTSTTVAADGSSTEKVQATATNTAGKEVAVTTTTKTDADGNVTSVTEKSVIADITKDTTATITVKTGGDGKVTSAKASVTKTSDSTKVSLSGKVLDQITEAAGADVNVRVSMTVKDNDGKTKYTVKADVNEVIPGEKLYIYKLDTKTGKYTMVDNKKYEVTKAGTVTVNMTKKATYELVTAEESKAITKEILATVKPAKKSKSLPVKNTTTFKLSDMLDMDNIKRITYATSKKSVATITKKGTIKAVKAGTATVKATVTLKNGTKKTIKMTIKVK